jgi:hypothetical protein
MRGSNDPFLPFAKGARGPLPPKAPCKPFRCLWRLPPHPHGAPRAPNHEAHEPCPASLAPRAAPQFIAKAHNSGGLRWPVVFNSFKAISEMQVETRVGPCLLCPHNLPVLQIHCAVPSLRI